MTRYAQIEEKVERLDAAADRCMENGKFSMGVIWKGQAFALSRELLDMSLAEAEQEVVSNDSNRA